MAEENISVNSKSTMIRDEMIARLVQTDAHFKHQQRGEPDLTPEEKSVIALDVLQRNPALFLERFSKYLTIPDTKFFVDKKEDYRVEFYVQEILKRCADTSKKVVKNRRYRAMQELMDVGEYFSEDEMKWRDPLLYEQMVGQYENDVEKTERMEQEIDKSDLKFSTILLKHMDTQANKQYFEILKEKEEEQEEEEEVSEDDDDDMDEDKNLNKAKQSKEHGDNEEISEMERSFLKTEFLRIMQERFLSGEDSAFDYSNVDTNTDYDSLDIVGHDAEEKYFDSDADYLSNESPSRDIHSDRILRWRMEGIDILSDEERNKGNNLKTDNIEPVEVDDYMSYTPCHDPDGENS